MSLRYEQYNSLKKTREFLRLLLQARLKDIRKKWLIGKICDCLKHFPVLYDSGQPIWSRDDFTEDIGEKCIWEYNNKSAWWDSSCSEGMYDPNNEMCFKYCPYCGKRIKIRNELV